MDIHPGLLLLLALACTHAHASISINLRVVPSVVDPTRTKNVTLSCTANEYTDGELKNISSLRIFKNHQSSWQLVAQVSDLEPTNVYVKDEGVTSQFGSIIQQGNVAGRLVISWYPATSSTLGQYKCLASRYNDNKDQIYTAMSTISLGSQLNALDILRVMESDKDEVSEKLDLLTEKAELYQETLNKSVNEDLAGLKVELASLEAELNETLADQNNQFSELREQILASVQRSTQDNDARLVELDRRVQQALDRGFLLLWPRGSYALPTPASGCPSSAGVAWETSWRKQHTQSYDRNKDEVSEGNHLLAPVRLIDSNQENYVYQRFCVKTNTISPGPVWPAGSYCIIKKGSCPAFFQTGSIKWDEHKSGGLSSSFGTMPDGRYFTSNTTIEYCCRADGGADEAIDLPRSQPFYLYRNGDQCQQVAGMSVSEEFIRFDTQNTNNEDAALGQHPDVQLNDVVLQLCYYKQASV